MKKLILVLMFIAQSSYAIEPIEKQVADAVKANTEMQKIVEVIRKARVREVFCELPTSRQVTVTDDGSGTLTFEALFSCNSKEGADVTHITFSGSVFLGNGSKVQLYWSNIELKEYE